jgi:hypothetical protein
VIYNGNKKTKGINRIVYSETKIQLKANYLERERESNALTSFFVQGFLFKKSECL